VIEHRNGIVTEVRASRDGPVIRGYAAMFDRLSHNLGGFREKIAPGAFRESLRQRDVLLLRNHNSDFPMARKSTGTLSVFEDRKGLAFDATLPNTSESRSVAVSIERGDVEGMSFAFGVAHPDDEAWEETSTGIIRTLKRVALFEVSTTPTPAYPQTLVSMDGERSAPKRTAAKRKAINRVTA